MPVAPTRADDIESLYGEGGYRDGPTSSSSRRLMTMTTASRTSLNCLQYGRHISIHFWILLGLFLTCCFIAHNISHWGCLLGVLITGWLLSLTMHEFGHAITAYIGGDQSVKDKGYLSLNLLRYTDPLMTFVVPTVLLLMGGVALPGGAVSIMTSRLRSPKWETFTSLAGPLSNLLFGAVLSLFLHLHILIFNSNGSRDAELQPALALLIYYQIMATVLNLIPLPPLDGWGALSPWLSSGCFLKRWMENPWHARSMTLVTLLLLFIGIQYIPGIRWLLTQLVVLYDVDQALLMRGQEEMFEYMRIPRGP